MRVIMSFSERTRRGRRLLVCAPRARTHTHTPPSNVPRGLLPLLSSRRANPPAVARRDGSCKHQIRSTTQDRQREQEGRGGREVQEGRRFGRRRWLWRPR